jgi:ureidoglycolate lyase
MTRILEAEPLTAAAFAPFGDVIQVDNAEGLVINEGYAHRFDNLARLDLTRGGGTPCLSIFRARTRDLPITIRMLERHPLGSQAFIPLSGHDYLIVVAPADDGPHFDGLRAFHARADQGVNYHCGIWHHPLLALHTNDDFLVIDRRGPGDNLEEAWYGTWEVRVNLISGIDTGHVKSRL